ncbi:Ethanolamine kinase 1-like isoform X2 [Aphelenchoides besseyi]|nr:Ethanolamine kinase 1-like isoform X2 [Aphelenchoides besseyi]
MTLSLDQHKIDSTKDDKTINEQIACMLKALRPKWNCDSLKFKRYTNGITNAVICVESPDDSEKLVVRIYGTGTENIIDRKTEMKHFEVLSRYEIAPTVHAYFKNGFVCGFLSGSPLNVTQVRSPKIVQRISEKLAKMHLLCHNDLLVYNLLYDEDEDEVHIIDYEYTAVNYQLFDIANHFCEYAVRLLGSDLALKKSTMISVQTTKKKMRFLETYLTCYLDRNPTKKELEDALVEIPKFEAVTFVFCDLMECASHLFWTLWALAQANASSIDFDYISYAGKRFEQFSRINEEIE